jgi:hypothetical protein
MTGKSSGQSNGCTQRLAERLGVTTHVSPLRYKLETLRQAFPNSRGLCLEDWLLDTANFRGARVVVREFTPDPEFRPPPAEVLSNEELVTGICLLQNMDRPQMLRVAAQMISGKKVDTSRLILLAKRERTEVVLFEMARQALKVEPAHSLWLSILKTLQKKYYTQSPIIHWTRLAEPVPDARGCNAQKWKLVA